MRDLESLFCLWLSQAELQGVFYKILKYSGLLPFSVFPWRQCVYAHQAGRTPVLQQNWQSSEKYQILRKSTIINEHPVLANCQGCLKYIFVIQFSGGTGFPKKRQFYKI